MKEYCSHYNVNLVFIFSGLRNGQFGVFLFNMVLQVSCILNIQDFHGYFIFEFQPRIPQVLNDISSYTLKGILTSWVKNINRNIDEKCYIYGIQKAAKVIHDVILFRFHKHPFSLASIFRMRETSLNNIHDVIFPIYVMVYGPSK